MFGTLGTLLNVAGIVIGALLGLAFKRDLPIRQQLWLKLLIGTALVVVGLKIAFSQQNGLLAGDWKHFGKLFVILLLSMIVGRWIGKALRIQKALNHVGHYAKTKLESGKRNDGLLAAVILFCAAPLGIVGAIEDGIANGFAPLLIKGLIDGLAAMSFARLFGARLLVAAFPVAALQSAVSFGALQIEPWLRAHQMLDSLNVVAGFLVVYVSLIVFEVKKVELGDYLPALVVGPALAALFR
jgi:uncharacterized membrane protein YqgA involved in biofilm formation